APGSIAPVGGANGGKNLARAGWRDVAQKRGCDRRKNRTTPRRSATNEGDIIARARGHDRVSRRSLLWRNEFDRVPIAQRPNPPNSRASSSSRSPGTGRQNLCAKVREEIPAANAACLEAWLSASGHRRVESFPGTSA